MTSIEIVIPGEPCAKGRPRIGKTRSGHAVAFTPAKTRTREGIVASAAMDAMKGRAVLIGPVHLSVCAVLGVAKSWSKKRRADALAGIELPTKRPDLDNIVKLIKDSLNGIVWLDDSQVVKLYASKVYGEIPNTLVIVNSEG